MYSRRMNARPFRNAGVAYRPKRTKIELGIQIKLAGHVRKTYPHVIFHSDYAAGLDLTANQAKINKAIQSKHKFPDFTIFAPGRINSNTGLPYIGLAIEIKKDGTPVVLKVGPDKGKLTKNTHIREQAATLRSLSEQGWLACFGVGYDQCQHIVDWYFENENTSLF
jgi:hypothetical protein